VSSFSRLDTLPEEILHHSLKDSIRVEKARRSIHAFTSYTFNDFISAKHNICMCEYIDAWVDGEIQNLMIFTPPRFGKTISENSRILLADGTEKEIKNIKIGDYVYSISFSFNMNLQKRKVISTLISGVKKLSLLKLINGCEIYGSREHRFYVCDESRNKVGYKQLKDILNNDLILTSIDGVPKYYKVDKIEYDVKEEKAYDLEIEGLHNYIANGIVTHNSEIVSRRLPPYILGRKKKVEVIATSYSQSLASFNSRKARNIISTYEYQKLFPYVQLSKERAAVEEWETTSDGSYKCAGIGGGIGGRGFHYGIIDDPVKERKEAESQTVREGIWDWYTSVFYTRRAPGAQILLITTRWHKEDLAGKLLTQYEEGAGVKWTVLNLPALCISNDDILGRRIGEPLWPERFSKAEMEQIRKVIGAYDWASLYEGSPVPSGGEKIKREWFDVIDKPPEDLTWYRYWDLAVTAKSTANRTASICMAKDEDGHYFLKDLIHGQWSWPQVRKIILTSCHIDGAGVSVGIEKGGQQGGFIDDVLADPQFADYDIKAYPADTDKLTRALPWIARAEARKIHLVRGRWINDFLDVCGDFTGLGDARDDEIDAVSGAYRMTNEVIETTIRLI